MTSVDEGKSIWDMFTEKPEADPEPKVTNKLDEMNRISSVFQKAAKAEKQTKDVNTDSEYFFCVYFENRDQKEAFLKQIGWFNIGDKYLKGSRVASKMGIDIGEKQTFPAIKSSNKFSDLVE